MKKNFSLPSWETPSQETGTCPPPAPAQMPKGMSALVEPYSKAHQPALHLMNLASLAQLAQNARFDFGSCDELDLTGDRVTFITCLVAPQGSGKSEMKKISELLTAKLQKKDDYNRSLLNQWFEDREYLGAREAGPKPRIGYNLLPPEATQAAFFENVNNLEGKSMLICAPEIDALNEKSCWARNRSVLRLSYDHDRGGQARKTSNGVNCYAKLYVNICTSGTPERVLDFFSNTEDGTVSRVIFGIYPDDRGQKYRKPLLRTPENKKEVAELIERLSSEEMPETPYSLPKITEALEKWTETKRNLFLLTGNDAIETFRRRSSDIALRAGAIAFLLEGHKETQVAIDFALWVAEIVLYNQTLLFGKSLNRVAAFNADILQAPGISTNDLIFAMLPSRFASKEIRTAYESRNMAGSGYRMIKSRWLDDEIIAPVEGLPGIYEKTAKGIELVTTIVNSMNRTNTDCTPKVVQQDFAA